MHEKSPARLLTALRFLVLLLLSFGALIGGAVLASRLDGIPRMISGLAGFGGYLLLFAAALRQLPVDWNMWLDRSLEGFRSPAGRSPLARGRAA
ncbi:MAG: hypothetical protein ACHQPI_09700 [Thermoanaerobaculia bacterium]